jgi:hypothetical protein
MSKTRPRDPNELAHHAVLESIGKSTDDETRQAVEACDPNKNPMPSLWVFSAG